MLHTIRKIVICFFIAGLVVKETKAQSACPYNIDFEQGNFDGWECMTGKVESIGGVNTVTWEQAGQKPDNHKIISRSTAQLDPYGNFPQICPNGSGYSVKLGNNYFQNISAEGIFYTFTIPDTAVLFSIMFHYAVVFQDPQHNPDEQPRFRARVYNVTDNTVVNCSDFDFTASASLPGFAVSTIDPTVIYKDWTPVTINLAGLSGKTLRLEFITSDCTFRGHFGYAYIDLSSSCSGAVTGEQICPDVTQLTLTAPYGFQTYTWYTDNSFSTVLATGQVLLLDPVPPPGTVLPVVVTPYPGFGCRDTLRAVLKMAPAPIADAGEDKLICSGTNIQLGTVPAENNSFSWSPPSQLLNPNSPMPLTITGLDGPTTFYLTVTSNLSGCISHDSVEVDVIRIDTAMRVIGDTAFCINKPMNTQLQLLATGAMFQWFENGDIVNGAVSNTYDPRPSGASGLYHAKISKGACEANSRFVVVNRLPVPVAGFSANTTEQCINGPVAVFNQSTEAGGFNDYIWQLSDGRTFNSKDISLSFSRAGNYAISLKAIAANGCRDSITKDAIHIVEKCGVFVPSAFTPGDDGKNDWFKPIFYGILKLRRFSIYDRAGMRIFTTTTTGHGWNGRTKGGAAVPTSLLIWTLEYESETGNTIFQKGTVMLIR